MTTAPVPLSYPTPSATLTATQFDTVAEISPKFDWFANLTKANPQQAYRQDIKDFQDFAGRHRSEQISDVTRAHVIALRQHLTRQGLANYIIRRKLAALPSHYAYLCARQICLHNSVLAVKRPRSVNREGVTLALGDHQAQMFLQAPLAETLKGKRDRAILATLLYHGLRCEELCKLSVGDIQQREVVPHLRVEAKGYKVRYLPLYVLTQRLITAYMQAAGHSGELHRPLFRPMKNNHTKTLTKALHPPSVYHTVVKHYASARGLTDVIPGLRVHSLRATAATNALAHEADIAEVQEWLGHADISTTCMYDKRQSQPEDSPAFELRY